LVTENGMSPHVREYVLKDLQLLMTKENNGNYLEYHAKRFGKFESRS
jgi:hypothetical protein